ncbi:MAG: hypothetical protein P8Y66_10675 [Nitrospirota bacterium]
MKTKVLAAVVVLVFMVAGTALAADIMVKDKPDLGKYLTDGKGMTLYYFKKDEPGQSNCTGGCLYNWPVFYAGEDPSVGEGLAKDDFGTITRSDGEMQTTFRGYPLYYYSGDGGPGDTKGEGLGDSWYVVNPEGFGTMEKKGGY